MFRLRAHTVKLSERDVKTACVDLLQHKGYWPRREHSGLFKTPDGRWVRMGEPGIPDYTVLHRKYPGFLLEFKRPRAKPSEVQIRKHWEIQAIWGLDIVTIDRVEDLQAWLAEREARLNGPQSRTGGAGRAGGAGVEETAG